MSALKLETNTSEFNQLLDEFLHWEEHRRYLSVNTIKARRAILSSLNKSQGGSLHRCDTEALESMLDARNLGASSRADYISHLKAFFRWYTDVSWGSHDPSFKLAIPKRPKRMPKPVPEKELEFVLRQAGFTRPLRTWLLLAAYEGMRCIEIASLRFENVDFDSGSILVTGKGNRERRLPLHPIVARELAPLRVFDRGWFFLNQRGSGASARWVSDTINRHLASCGVQYTAHKLRHRFATQVYQNTGDLLTVQKLLGHQSLETTQVYVAWRQDALRDAVNGLA